MVDAKFADDTLARFDAKSGKASAPPSPSFEADDDDKDGEATDSENFSRAKKAWNTGDATGFCQALRDICS